MHTLETGILVFTNNRLLISQEAYTKTIPSQTTLIDIILFMNCSIVFGVTDNAETISSFTHFQDTLFFLTSVAAGH